MNPKSVHAKVFYTRTALQYLDDLIDILYSENYFGFEEFAQTYVDKLMDDVRDSIHIRQKYKVPLHFKRYGTDLYYVTYPKNKRTTWYFFFTLHTNDTYVIRYITNNHVAGHLL